jgi:hypothetical protein
MDTYRRGDADDDVEESEEEDYDYGWALNPGAGDIDDHVLDHYDVSSMPAITEEETKHDSPYESPSFEDPSSETVSTDVLRSSFTGVHSPVVNAGYDAPDDDPPMYGSPSVTSEDNPSSYGTHPPAHSSFDPEVTQDATDVRPKRIKEDGIIDLVEPPQASSDFGRIPYSSELIPDIIMGILTPMVRPSIFGLIKGEYGMVYYPEYKPVESRRDDHYLFRQYLAAFAPIHTTNEMQLRHVKELQVITLSQDNYRIQTLGVRPLVATDKTSKETRFNMFADLKFLIRNDLGIPLINIHTQEVAHHSERNRLNVLPDPIQLELKVNSYKPTCLPEIENIQPTVNGFVYRGKSYTFKDCIVRTKGAYLLANELYMLRVHRDTERFLIPVGFLGGYATSASVYPSHMVPYEIVAHKFRNDKKARLEHAIQLFEAVSVLWKKEVRGDVYRGAPDVAPTKTWRYHHPCIGLDSLYYDLQKDKLLLGGLEYLQVVHASKNHHAYTVKLYEDNIIPGSKYTYKGDTRTIAEYRYSMYYSVAYIALEWYINASDPELDKITQNNVDVQSYVQTHYPDIHRLMGVSNRDDDARWAKLMWAFYHETESETIPTRPVDIRAARFTWPGA